MNSISKKDFLKNCNTGDILLFSTKHWYSKLIEFFTQSKFSHIGIILKDPIYIKPTLKGLYLFESGAESKPSPEDGKKKYGVQITKLEDILDSYSSSYLGNLYYRKLDCDRNKDFYDKIKKIHDKTYNKPYDIDIIDWIKAEFDIKLGNEQKTNTYWCSALTAFTYVNLGFLKEDLPWTIIKPSEFSYIERKKNLDFLNCNLKPEEIIKFK